MLIVLDAAVAVGWYTAALGVAELWNLGGVAGLHIRRRAVLHSRGGTRPQDGAEPYRRGPDDHADRGLRR